MPNRIIYLFFAPLFVLMMGILLYRSVLSANRAPGDIEFIPEVTDISMALRSEWGDYDRDGDLDLAASGRTGLPVAVYVADNQQLSETPIWQHTTFAHVVLWGDLNRDGWLDLLVGDKNANLAVFMNNAGQLPSEPSQLFATAAFQIDDLALGDIDGDGWLEVVVAGVFKTFVYGNLNGTISTSAEWEVNNGADAVALADANNDGQLDLAVGDTFDVRLYLNQGSSLATSAAWQQTLSGAVSMLGWGEVNGDDQLDLAVAHSDGIALYLHNGGQLNATASWTVSDASATIDFGDVDRDGDLDLLAQWGNTSRYAIYRNSAGVLDSAPAFTTADTTGLTSIRWGDADYDGDLDFVTSGLSYASVLYSNEQLPFGETAVWSTFSNGVQQLRLVDYDTDGDLDLTTAQENWIDFYPNNGGTFDSFPADFVEVDASADIERLIWHDIDLDGDPDLITIAAATAKLWRNDGGLLSFIKSAPFASATNAAWSDLDGDGYPELAVVGLGGAAIYPNNSGTLGDTPLWEDAFNRFTRIVAWADVDNDGDNDLTIGDDQFYRTYRNESGMLTLIDGFTVLSNESARAIAWGDYDGDGDLDLAAEPRVRVYRNDGTQLTHAWEGDTLIERLEFAWRDVDGDRDLDLVYGPIFEAPNAAAVFINERGTLRQTSAEIATDASVTTGDIDGDGRLDAVTYSANQLRVLPNPYPANPINGQPLALGISAEFAPSPEAGSGKLHSGTLPIPFTLSATAGTVRGYYSLNGGGAWLPAVAASGTPTSEVSSGAHTFLWDIAGSGFLGNSDKVVFRLEATPSYLPEVNGVSRSFQQPLASATTYPFRVRGTQVRVVDEGGQAVEEAVVYRLPSSQTTGGAVLSGLDGTAFETDGAGYLRGRGQIALGDQLLALHPMTETERYTVYHTSAAPTPTGMDAVAISQLGEQVLTVSAENPLILFNFAVSLEWNATQDPDFLTRLDLDLKRASEILYDLSNGQAALGNVTVYHDKENWYESDVVVLADNSHRPNANLGGIVSEPISDTLKSGEVVSFAALPGQIRMGATWNRYGNPDGTLGEDWPRVLAHEIGHYAFFLIDNYLGVDDATGLLVNTDCQGSAMTDAYRPDYSEFVNSAEWSGGCLNTLAEDTTGRSDWETIQAFYPFLNDNIGQTGDGPSRQPFAFTSVRIVTQTDSATPLAAPIFYMEDAAGTALTLADGAAKAYIFQTNDPLTATDDTIISLGSPRGQVINARGIRAGDRLCVFNEASVPPRQGCIDNVTALSSTISLAEFPAWQPEIVVQPVNSTTLAITVTHPAAVGDLYVQLFPTDRPTTTIVAETVQLSSADDGVYTAEISSLITIFNAHVRVFDDGNSAETITRFSQTLGWGGNTIVSWGGNTIVSWGGNTIVSWGGNTIVSWGGNTIVSWGGNSLGIYNAPVASPNGQVVILNTQSLLGIPAPTILQTVPNAPQKPIWLEPVGEIYRYTVDRAVTETLAIQFSYLERTLPSIPESQLAIYHFIDGDWTRLATIVDSERNLAVAKMQGRGIYALMATIEIPAFSVGWNNFGYPLAETQTISRALSSISGNYTSVYHYASSPTSRWLLFDTTVAAPFDELVNDLENFEFAQAYWVYATRPVTGYLPIETSIARRNQLTLPPLTVYGYVTTTGSFPIVVGDLVEARINGTLCGKGEIVTLGDQLAYKMQIATETVLGASNGCGDEDRIILLTINGQTAASGFIWSQQQSLRLDLATTTQSSVGLLHLSTEIMVAPRFALLAMLLLTWMQIQKRWRD